MPTAGRPPPHLGAAEQEEEADEGDQREQDVAQQADVVALLLALRHADVNACWGSGREERRDLRC